MSITWRVTTCFSNPHPVFQGHMVTPEKMENLTGNEEQNNEVSHMGHVETGTTRASPRIVIVGGGIAGLSAASCLHKAGMTNWVILEATDRLGGRVHTVYGKKEQDGKECSIEMGATFIHGIHGNPIWELAKENNLPCGGFGQRQGKNGTRRHRRLAVDENGRCVPSKIISQGAGMFSQLTDECKVFFHRQGAGHKSTWASVDDYIRNAWEKNKKEMMHKFNKEQPHYQDLLLEYYLKMETVSSGCNCMSQVSLNEFGSYVDLDGPHPIFKGGYQSVVEVLTQTIPKDQIMLNSPVINLKWNSSDTCKGGECSSILVTCENGSYFEADCAIFTASLGFLKERMQTIFHPPLPDPYQDAIRKLGIGTVNKIYLEFENVDFIPAEASRLMLLWDKGKEEMDDMSQTWVRKVYSIDIDYPAPGFILGWISGKEAEYMETLTDEEVISSFLHILRHFLKVTDIPYPKQIIRSKWFSNPYQRGSYSYPQVGATAQHIKTLAEPIVEEETGKPLILFAGEATHPAFYSTTHGALLSGERAAGYVVQEYMPENTR